MTWHCAICGRKQRLASVARGRLQRLGLDGHPGLFVCMGQEGYADYVFGFRAGPSYDLFNLFHELAHAAEFGPDAFRARTLGGRFVFRMKMVQILYHMVPQQNTMGSTMRELRTFAHQYQLMRLAGCKMGEAAFFGRAVRFLVEFMPDWCFVPGRCDEEKAAFCVQQAQSFYRSLEPCESLSRLVGWLDKTARRLKRLGAGTENTPQNRAQSNRKALRLDKDGQWQAV